MRKTVSGTPAQARAYLDALKLAELPGAPSRGAFSVITRTFYIVKQSERGTG
jgi:hypothetical protein